MQRSPQGGRPGRRAADAFVKQAQAQAMVKRHADLFKSAVLFHRDGADSRAEGLCRLILSEDPRNVQACHMLGLIALKYDKLQGALEFLGKAVHAAPKIAEPRVDYAAALRAGGQIDQAIVQLRRAIEIKPGLAIAWGNLGNALAAQEEPREAETAYRRALDLNPEMANVTNNLGQVLVAQERNAEAEAMFRRAIALKPDYALAHVNLAMTLNRLGRKQEARESFDAGVAFAPESLGMFQGLMFQDNYFHDDDPRQALANALAYGDLLARRAPVRAHHENDPDPDRRIKVGMVSGDLRNHPVGIFVESVLSHIDASKIELSAYVTVSREDDRTQRIKACFAQWQDVSNLEDDELESRIVAGKIDILLDMSGYTAHNRLSVFARKPAPISASWIGYFATTGVKAIDYVLCDRWVIPEGEEYQWVETPWRLPYGYLCFTPPRQEVQIGPQPCQKSGELLFGSFNNPNKLSDEAIETWSQILAAMPTSRLLLRGSIFEKTREVRKMEDRFRALGISPGRLLLEPATSDYLAHLDSYNRVDLALDPFPYAGGTTTVEALWMGVPVLTLKGDRYVSHMGEGILHHVGLDDWIAEDRADYVAKAVRYATDIEALATLRARLRAQMLASPLCDAPRFARQLEDAFRQMWRIWCDGRRAESAFAEPAAVDRADG